MAKINDEFKFEWSVDSEGENRQQFSTFKAKNLQEDFSEDDIKTAIYDFVQEEFEHRFSTFVDLEEVDRVVSWAKRVIQARQEN